MLNVFRPDQIGANKGVKYFIISNHVKLIITDIEVKSFFAKSLMCVCFLGFFFVTSIIVVLHKMWRLVKSTWRLFSTGSSESWMT